MVFNTDRPMQVVYLLEVLKDLTGVDWYTPAHDCVYISRPKERNPIWFRAVGYRTIVVDDDNAWLLGSNPLYHLEYSNDEQVRLVLKGLLSKEKLYA